MKSPSPFVLFDLGGVLADINVPAATAHWARETGVTADRWAQLFFSSGLKEEMDKGLKTIEAVVEELNKSAPMTLELFTEGWGRVLTLKPEMSSLASEVVSILPCGLLSNTDPVHHLWAQESVPALSMMQRQFVSYEAGCWKPEVRFYRLVIDALGIPPHAVFFVDDLPRNVTGAKKAGMDAVVYRSKPELQTELSVRFPDIQFSWT